MIISYIDSLRYVFQATQDEIERLNRKLSSRKNISALEPVCGVLDSRFQQKLKCRTYTVYDEAEGLEFDLQVLHPDNLQDYPQPCMLSVDTTSTRNAERRGNEARKLFYEEGIFLGKGEQ